MNPCLIFLRVSVSSWLKKIPVNLGNLCHRYLHLIFLRLSRRILGESGCFLCLPVLESRGPSDKPRLSTPSFKKTAVFSCAIWHCHLLKKSHLKNPASKKLWVFSRYVVLPHSELPFSKFPATKIPLWLPSLYGIATYWTTFPKTPRQKIGVNIGNFWLIKSPCGKRSKISIKCAGGWKKVEYFQTFHINFRTFLYNFRTFLYSFQTFSNVFNHILINPRRSPILSPFTIIFAHFMETKFLFILPRLPILTPHF